MALTASPTAAPTVTYAGQCCWVLAPGSLTGKTAYCRRGLCPFSQKVAAAEAAGAVGVVIINYPGDNTITDTSGDGTGLNIPATFTGHSLGWCPQPVR